MKKTFRLITILLITFLFSLMSVNATIFFNDSFQRPNSNTLGNGWVETESGAGLVSIDDNRMKLDNNAMSPGEAATRTFDSQITVNIFNWTFTTNASQTTAGLELQLRDSSARCIDLRYGTDGNWHYVNGVPTDVDVGVAYIVDAIQTHVVVVDQSATTFDWFVDGSLILNDGDYRDGSCTAIDNVDYSGGSGGPLGQFYITDIFVLDEPVPLPPILQFTNITLQGQAIVNNSLFNLTSLDFSTNVSFSDTNSNINHSYSLDSANFTQYATNNPLGNFTLNSLSNGLHTIKFFAENNETDVTSLGYNFLIDTNPPNLTVTLPSEINTFDINFTQYINFSDENNATCTVFVVGTSTNTSCLNESFTFTFNGNRTLDVIVIDGANNFNFSLNNLLLVNPPNAFYFNDGSSNVTNFTYGGRSDNGNGFVSYDTYNDGLSLGLNTLLFEKLGFVADNFSFTLTNTTQLNTTFNISPAQIIVNIFNRVDGSVFLFSTDITIFGLGNLTTSTGQAIFQNFSFPAGNFSVEAESVGFYTEQQTFTYSGESNVTINLFLLDASLNNSATLIVPTIDEWDNVLAGVDVRLQEYDPTIFGFKQVSQCISNSNGECQFLIEQSTKSYRIIGTVTINGIDYTATNPIPEGEGEIFLPIISGGSEVLGEEIIRQLRLKISEELVPSNFLGLTITAPANANATILLTNSTSTIINVPINFISTSGLSYTVCFEIFAITGNSFNEVISPICTTGASGTLPTVNITLNNDFDYEARITVEFDNIKGTFQTYLYPNTKSFAQVLLNESLVPNMVLFFWVILLGVSMYLRNIGIWSWGAMFLGGVQLFLFANLLVASSSVIIIVINAIVLYVSKKEVDLQ